jgi:uncharacterized protein (DUF58 family)
LALLLFAAAVAMAAESLASLALFALAVGLALVAACAGIAVMLAASRVTVVRTIAQREVQEDAAVRLRFDVQGIKWLPVELQGQDQSGNWLDVARADALVEITVGRRGAYRLVPSRLRLRDVFGICERPLRAGRAESLLILPTPVVPPDVGPRAAATVDDPEPGGLQAHTPGAPIARIHWPTLARGAGLHLRRFAAEESGLPLVVVDTAGTRDQPALDWAARTAAGHILALARSGGCRVLLPGDASATTVTEPDARWRALHRRLARLEASPVGASPRMTGHAATVRIRAAAAPAGLSPRPLPAGVVPLASDHFEAQV